MTLLRRMFAAALLAVPLMADAGSAQKQKKPQPPEVKSSATASINFKTSTLPKLHDCTKEEIAARPRVDVITDLQTGEILYLSKNLTKDTLDSTKIYPASLTKIEAVKEIARRIRDKIWTPSTEFNVATRNGNRSRPFTLVQSVLMSLGPSLNVLDDIAQASGPDFLASMNAHMLKIGMKSSHYASPTGNPDNPAVYPDVRKTHVTTVGDILRSIQDFELEYATSSASQDTFGLEKITGIWQIPVKGLHRDTHPLTVLETAQGPKAHPYQGVTSGKSGYVCVSGFISYVRYDDHLTKRPFIVFTAGHPTAQARDLHTTALLNDNMGWLRSFAEEQKLRNAILPPAQAVPASAALSAELK